MPAILKIIGIMLSNSLHRSCSLILICNSFKACVVDSEISSLRPHVCSACKIIPNTVFDWMFERLVLIFLRLCGVLSIQVQYYIAAVQFLSVASYAWSCRLRVICSALMAAHLFFPQNNMSWSSLCHDYLLLKIVALSVVLMHDTCHNILLISFYT